jgi:hypothetical protein
MSDRRRSRNTKSTTSRTWQTTEPCWVVLSWHPDAPRETVRLDGYYYDHAMAEDVAACGAWGRRAGYCVIVLTVSVGAELGGIPDALFDVAPGWPVPTDACAPRSPAPAS